MGNFLVTIGLYSDSCGNFYELNIGAFDSIETAKKKVEKALSGNFRAFLSSLGIDESEDILFVHINKMPDGFGKARVKVSYRISKDCSWSCVPLLKTVRV